MYMNKIGWRQQNKNRKGPPSIEGLRDNHQSCVAFSDIMTLFVSVTFRDLGLLGSLSDNHTDLELTTSIAPCSLYGIAQIQTWKLPKHLVALTVLILLSQFLSWPRCWPWTYTLLPTALMTCWPNARTLLVHLSYRVDLIVTSWSSSHILLVQRSYPVALTLISCWLNSHILLVHSSYLVDPIVICSWSYSHMLVQLPYSFGPTHVFFWSNSHILLVQV